MTRYEPDAAGRLRRVRGGRRASATPTRCSPTTAAPSIEQVAALLRGERIARSPQTIATAESCTGGLLAARLTELPGSSDYFKGGIVVYSNEAKIAAGGRAARADRDATGRSRRRSPRRSPTARATRLGADVGVGVTGVAGPGGGTEEKPVGLVWLSVALAGAEPLTRSVNLPGGRADVRDRATTVAMHLVRRALIDWRVDAT